MPRERTLREVTLRPTTTPTAALRAGRVAKRLLRVPTGGITLFEDNIKVCDTTAASEALPRRYTVTRHGRTAELFLSVGADARQEAPGRQPIRQQRDEVWAELTDGPNPRLSFTCLAGSDALSSRTFEEALPFALAVIRYGDRFFFERHPEMDQAQVLVELPASGPRTGAGQEWGRITDYRVTRIAGESRRLAFGAALAALGLGALILGKLRGRGGGGDDLMA